MPELVACPVCDCRILVNEMQLGRRIRCIGCEQTFVAGEPPPVREPTTYSLGPGEVVDEAPEVVHRRVEPARHRQPLCPKCHRPVGWKDLSCAHCGHEFDPEDSQDRASWHLRRDAHSHRGDLIGQLGGYAFWGGCVASCTGGLGALVALACGIPVLWMARQDLNAMKADRMDPAGRDATEAGCYTAVIGILLALLFSVLWLLLLL